MSTLAVMLSQGDWDNIKDIVGNVLLFLFMSLFVIGVYKIVTRE